MMMKKKKKKNNFSSLDKTRDTNALAKTET